MAYKRQFYDFGTMYYKHYIYVHTRIQNTIYIFGFKQKVFYVYNIKQKGAHRAK